MKPPESGEMLGLCRYRHLLNRNVHIGIPALEDGTQLSVERLHANRVLSARNVLAAGELQDRCLVEQRDRREVETVETFHRREPPL
jgi:hypothetical protein